LHALFALGNDAEFEKALRACIRKSNFPDEQLHEKEMATLSGRIHELETELKSRQTDRERQRLQAELSALS
jgi:hypothetical protein